MRLMNMSLRALPVLLALACTPAAFAQGGLGGKPWNPQDQVSFSAIRTGSNSRIETQGMYELVTEGDFQVYWARSTGQAPETAPRIDWNRQKVVAIHLGKRPTGGYSVMVQRIQKDITFATITAVERKPVPGQYVSEGITSPFVLIRVDRLTIPFKLSLTEARGGLVPGGNIIITDPGTVIVNPNDHSRRNGGGVDPRFDVDWSTYDTGFRCHQGQSGAFPIDNEAQWQNYWSRMTGRPPYDAPRDVDWFNYRLVAVHLGTRPTGGFSIRVSRVEKNGMTGIIRAIEQTPVPGSMVTQAQTSPYTIIRVPRGLMQFKLEVSKRDPGNVRVID